MTMDTNKKLAVFIASAIVLAVLPFVVGNTLGNSWVRTIDFALLYVMLALGLNIVVGFAGLLDLGFIAFYAVGAYTFALLGSPHFDIHLPFYISIPLGAGLAAMFGLLLGTPVLKLKGDYLAIVTLGFGEIVRIFMNNLNAPVNITNGPQGINLIDPIQIGGVSLGKAIEVFGFSLNPVHMYYYVFLFLTVVVVIMVYRLQHSRIGRAWVAMREDSIAAAAMGLNIRNIKLLAFALGALSGGVAGGLFATFQGFISPESFGLLESIMILAMVVLGGMGHIPGVILGAVVLTIAPEVLRDVIGPLQMHTFGKMIVDPENARMLLFGAAMVIMMLVRPEGMWPSKRRAAEFKDAKKG
ncbi:MULTISPECIES: ABC transporter permease subunit [Vogesella]|uniref:ABC transporter ATP-binding protein n=1 Tax=Vogesella indigofera TaxID=45465 RepID=A0A495B7Y2_VOGIN|nr:MULTISPECIES: ABC transporter ATP-binding protein [Vogesella]KMJ53188.1 ABC transporter ATP-binding protein [Vogesella sp. EB]MCQ4144683.1 ABC transporter ATP-binding protein [Vogesella sp. AC12]MDC7691192.1 ABC transporter ATP-binding protein [Vogesella indigofera]MDC7696592.1 ABC transporter ATP-binding protein [Vogesella indigofera]RKQ57071.1 amino acid/amide ABC transporter membrane protein 2 (HAAT family) [Vogesella indigofera]